MKLRAVLVSSPLSLRERYGAFSEAGSSQPSFGLACLAAVARREGVVTRVIDASAESLAIDDVFAQIIALRPNVVGISSTTVGIVAAGKLAERLKNFQPSILIVIGGCHVTALPEETLQQYGGFDAAILGEGEEALIELLKSYRELGEIPHDLMSMALREKDNIRINKRRPFIDDLDSLPLPAWDLIQGFPDKFRPSPSRVRRYPCASLVLTRGCPNKCSFCDRSVFGNRCRSYSPSRAVEIFEDLAERYNIREILVEDDTFIVIRKWVQEFCERLISSKLDISWSCLGRADRISPDLLRLMRRAGCWHISYGIESGDKDILSAMGKNLEIQQIEQAVRWSNEAGLMTKGFFIVGFPGETRRSSAATRELAKRLPLDDISVMQLTPFPGTDVYRTAEEMGAFDRDWSKMNTLTTVFVPQGLLQEDLDQARSDMIRQFYFRPGILARKLFQTLRNPGASLQMLAGLWVLLKVSFPRLATRLFRHS